MNRFLAGSCALHLVWLSLTPHPLSLPLPGRGGAFHTTPITLSVAPKPKLVEQKIIHPVSISVSMDEGPLQNSLIASAPHGKPKLPRGPGKHTEVPVLHPTTIDGVLGWGNPLPIYPEQARKEGIEGEVLVELRFTQGKVASAQIKTPSGSELLDEAVLSTVQLWTLPPEMDSTDMITVIPFSFRLKIIHP